MLSAGCTPLAAGLPRLAAAAACCTVLGHLLSLPSALRQRRKGVAFSAAPAAAGGATDAAAGEAFAAATKQVSLTINGRQVQVPEGSSILTAATTLGIHVSMAKGTHWPLNPPTISRGHARSALPSAPRSPFLTAVVNAACRCPRCAPTRACPPPPAPAGCAWWRPVAASSPPAPRPCGRA